MPDGVTAFNAIIKDIGLVFNLDYRHETFKKWKSVVEKALEFYMGEMHPRTVEFRAINFKDQLSGETPPDQKVTMTDELIYSAGLESTKEILEKARDEVKASMDAAARKAEEAKKAKDAPPGQAPGILGAAAPAGGAAEPPPVTGIRIVRTSIDEDMAEPAGMDADKPEGAAKTSLIERQEAGPHQATTAKKGTLEGYIKGLEDPAERSLVMRLIEEVDEPRPEWGDVQSIMLEIWNLRPEMAKELLPLILNR